VSVTWWTSGLVDRWTRGVHNRTGRVSVAFVGCGCITVAALSQLYRFEHLQIYLFLNLARGQCAS
jgi:hypothetical protein